MKIKAILFLLSCFLWSTSLKAQLRKTTIDSIPSSVLKNAKILAFDAFKFQKDKDLSKFLFEHANLHLNKVYDLKMNNEFTERVYNAYGKLIKVALQEVLVDKNGDYVFRFKGYHDKTNEISEIRLRTNSLFKFNEFVMFAWYYEKYHKDPQNVPLKKLNIDTLSKKNIERAYELVEKSWKCKEENYFKLTPENATPTMLSLYSKEKMNEYCSKTNRDLGHLTNITLAEVLGDGYRTIYRYKTEYELIENFFEIFVVTNSEDKFHMMFILPEWNDTFKDYKL